jgi:cholinesterase
MTFSFITILCILSSLFSFTIGQQKWTVGQAVDTTSGKISGMASTKIPTVSQYLGIPFAQPPIGPNRWLKPQDYNSTANFKAVKQAA